MVMALKDGSLFLGIYMDNTSIWIILAAGVAILLITYWERRKAVLALGIAFVILLVIALLPGFQWARQGFVLGIILGFGVVLLGKVSDKIRGSK